LSIL
jgi:hypothetical protein